MARKLKKIWRVRKNRYGNPILTARSPVAIEVGGKLYSTVHLYATLCDVRYTLYSDDHSVEHLTSMGCWESMPGMAFQHFADVRHFERVVESILKELEAGKIPGWMTRLQHTMASIMI
jgi:hypothetical protein